MKELQVLLLAVAAVSLTLANPLKRDIGQVTKVDLLMPHVHPVIVDSYLCRSMKMSKDPLYIIGYEPKASMVKAHHMLIYGCTIPGSNKGVWDCGEMHTDTQEFETAPVCGNNNAKIVYAWGMDAPELKLPADVAFKVGDDSDIQYLVLQVHYKDVSFFLPPKNETDVSGVRIITTDVPQPKRAGVYLMGTGGVLIPNAVTYFETACSYNDRYVMHPFAFRAHAHTHGRVNVGYRVRNGQWTEIGRMSPRIAQMFYNVTNPGMTVRNGDILAARCTMISDEDEPIKIGATSKDEMCNFYIMYYVDGDHQLSQDYCFSAGPPNWYWTDFEGLDTSNVPLSASIIPGTDEVITGGGDQVLERMEQSMNKQHDRMNGYMERLLDTLGNRNEPQGPEPAGDFNEVPRMNDVIGNDIYDDRRDN